MIKNKKNKGFTLVELLATITILGILIVISVPNIVNITQKNKEQAYIELARKMVVLAQQKMDSNKNITRPTITSSGKVVCILMKSTTLLKDDSLTKGPENGDVNAGNLSFVLIKYDPVEKTYRYGVQLVETYKKNSKTYKQGIKFIEDSNILLNNKDDVELIDVSTTNNVFLDSTKVSTNCNEIKEVN